MIFDFFHAFSLLLFYKNVVSCGLWVSEIIFKIGWHCDLYFHVWKG